MTEDEAKTLNAYPPDEEVDALLKKHVAKILEGVPVCEDPDCKTWNHHKHGTACSVLCHCWAPKGIGT